MPSTSKLFSIDYVDDDDTGLYKMGEIWGIPKNDLDEYISTYGARELLDVLVELIHVTKTIEKEKKERAEKLESLNCGLNGRDSCNI